MRNDIAFAHSVYAMIISRIINYIDFFLAVDAPIHKCLYDSS
jgi:hypothetical protein